MIPRVTNIDGQHLMKSDKTNLIRIFIFCIVIIFISIGIYGWWVDGISPVDPNNTKLVSFSVQNGESIKTISTKLAQNNLIRSPTAFFILIKLNGIERNLQAGEFRLSQSMDAKTVSEQLTHGRQDAWITIIEGWRVEEIATKLTQKFEIPETEFLKFAQEGYMFPDTYSIPQNATAASIANIFRANFDQKITLKMREDLKSQKISLSEVIILASIVEREGKSDEDRPVIAGILFNRLKIGMPLQADATLQYSLGYQSKDRSWWKKDLSQEDKKIDSPYNTYIYTGLPKAPIANPGLSAINAVIYPKKNTYLYYIHDKNGVAHYAQTIEQHNENIRKYLQ